uniref:Uncharacterized protein n=1 Tax=Lepeophtheirus salmonis TaxID=72036 RepID=A0A0K2UL20_LEPSM
MRHTEMISLEKNNKRGSEGLSLGYPNLKYKLLGKMDGCRSNELQSRRRGNFF